MRSGLQRHFVDRVRGGTYGAQSSSRITTMASPPIIAQPPAVAHISGLAQPPVIARPPVITSSNALKEQIEANNATRDANREEFERQEIERQLVAAKLRREETMRNREHQTMVSE